MIGNNKIIALCISRVQDSATNDYITGLYHAVKDKGYRIFVFNTCTKIGEEDYRDNVQTRVFDLIDYDIVDVMIVFEEVMENRSLSDELIRRSLEHKVATIVIGEAHEGCVNIKYDHKNGFSQIVRHIVCDHKITDLHFMAGIKGNYFSEQRILAFKNVLEENSLPFDKESMVSYGDFWTDPTEAAVLKLIEENRVPKAIICANDKMAIAVCNTLLNKGIRVPEDVAVTGFDGVLEVMFTSPRITTVITDNKDLANRTAEVLMNWEKWKGKTETLLVPLRVFIGQSCGCDGMRPINASEYLIDVNDRFYRYQDEDIMLSKIIAQIQRCENVEQIAKPLKNGIFYEFACMVEKEYLDDKVNPMVQIEHKNDRDRELYVLYECNRDDYIAPYLISARQMLPRIEELLELNRVLIFSTLHHLDVALGYVCFYYESLDAGNYTKLPQTMNALNNALGGYRVGRHKQYLMNQINEMYRIDTLTGLRNRRGFDLEYREMLLEKAEDESLTVMLVDLDGLKYINDNYGHKEGDFAIYTVAKAMKKVCPEGSIFTRFGGDEMMAVCKGKHDIDQLKASFYGYFDDFNAKSDKKYDVLASMGVYHTGEDDDLSFEGIIEKTDVLMYMEKTKRKKQRVR